MSKHCIIVLKNKTAIEKKKNRLWKIWKGNYMLSFMYFICIMPTNVKLMYLSPPLTVHKKMICWIYTFNIRDKFGVLVCKKYV